MVADPGAEGRPRALRPLAEPTPIEVQADAMGRPVAAMIRGRRFRVTEVLDRWCIEDEWWRDWPVSRMYFLEVLEDGQPLTLFQDLVTGHWFQQRYD